MTHSWEHAADRYSEGNQRGFRRFLPMAGLLLVYLLLCQEFFTFTNDDPFIVFRYADNIRRGLGPVMNLGRESKDSHPTAPRTCHDHARSPGRSPPVGEVDGNRMGTCHHRTGCLPLVELSTAIMTFCATWLRGYWQQMLGSPFNLSTDSRRR